MARSTLSLPYAHLNLRRNPFGERTPDERARLAIVDVGPWVARLTGPRGTVQFVGESGRGKTTRLLALRRSLPEATLIRIHPEDPPDLPNTGILLLDEAQYLSPSRRRALFAGPAALALGTHVDFTRELPSTGRDVETVQLRGLSADHLAAMVKARIEDARRGPGPVPRVGPVAIQALLARYGDDVRAMENRLYDAIQEMEEPVHVEV